MTQQQTERDDALIAEARKNIEKICPALKDDTRTIAAEVLRLARENWTPPAKADRYVEAWKEAKAAYIYPNRTEHESDQVAAAVLRRHFEPPSEVVEAAEMVQRLSDGSAAGTYYASAKAIADFILKGSA